MRAPGRSICARADRASVRGATDPEPVDFLGPDVLVKREALAGDAPVGHGYPSPSPGSKSTWLSTSSSVAGLVP